MEYIDINSSNLLAPPAPLAYDPIEPKIGALPLDKLPWEDFEKLCAHLIQHAYKGNRLQVFRYGRAGQNQKGIDIIWQASLEEKCAVAQVKRWKKVKPRDIENWVDTFLNAGLADQANTWILCLSIDIQEDTQLIEAWRLAMTKLRVHGISAEIWHKGWIESLLRNVPALVEVFFSRQIRERFCHTLSMPDKEPQHFRDKVAHVHDSRLTLENQSVRMEVQLPTSVSQSVSAILSFARTNLAGVSLAIDGKDLVQWLQWAGHPHHPEKGPYTLALDAPDRFLLTTQKFQLSLSSVELKNLDWCLQQAWTHYLNKVEGLEANWRCIRFAQMTGSSGRPHKLYSVSRELWRLIMQYVREHDYGKGESEDHVFDASGNGVLKVFSHKPKASLDAGYHLILYTYQEGGICSANGTSLILGWRPDHLCDEALPWGPRGLWDAELTHDWLGTTLLPKVLHWFREKRRSELSLIKNPVQKLTGNLPAIDPDEHLLSYARFSVQHIMEAGSPEALSTCLHTMQLHFNMYCSPATIEKDLVLPVLRCVKHLAYRLPEEHHAYIRGNLQLATAPLVEGLEALMGRLTDHSCSTSLDMALRSLICCSETITNISDDLKWIKAKLEPVWARMREDLLCEMFC